MYFLLNMGDFPVSHVSFQGVVRGIFLHCPGVFSAVQNLSTGHGLGHHLSPAPGASRDDFLGASKGGKDGKDGDTLLKFTPWKINDWFTYSHHPFFSKENDLNQASMIMEPMLIFQGVTWNITGSVATQIIFVIFSPRTNWGRFRTHFD